MKIGIGLPATIPGVSGDAILTWARHAEQDGFSTLAALDRLAYDNLEPVAALAAVAGVTRQIRLATTVLVAPLREPVVLAKQLATIDRISGGRLTVGVAPGDREDDFVVAGADRSTRGRRLDDDLGLMQRVWSQERVEGAGPIGPAPVQTRPPLWIGGTSAAAYRRAAHDGEGWVFSGGNPAMLRACLDPLVAQWREAGREGRPYVVSLAYFALGAHADERAQLYLRPYYAWLGDDVAASIAAGAPTDERDIRGLASAFRAAGCDELILAPCDPDPDQVHRLADVLSPGQRRPS